MPPRSVRPGLRLGSRDGRKAVDGSIEIDQGQHVVVVRAGDHVGLVNHCNRQTWIGLTSQESVHQFSDGWSNHGRAAERDQREAQGWNCLCS